MGIQDWGPHCDSFLGELRARMCKWPETRGGSIRKQGEVLVGRPREAVKSPGPHEMNPIGTKQGKQEVGFAKS